MSGYIWHIFGKEKIRKRLFTSPVPVSAYKPLNKELLTGTVNDFYLFFKCIDTGTNDWLNRNSNIYVCIKNQVLPAPERP